ncbi:hypothetical protein [Bacillus sp. SBS7]|uniref:hypothetical protein n=1 Tax=Bacillus sp. SBS7 TaxID=3401756 RepID=UPI003AA7BEBC
MPYLKDHGLYGGNSNPLYQKSYFNKLGKITMDISKIPRPRNIIYLGGDKLLVVADDKTSFIYNIKSFVKSTPTGDITNLPNEITIMERLLELGDHFGVSTDNKIIIYSKATQSKVKEVPHSSIANSTGAGRINDIFYVDKDITLLIVARKESAECFYFNKNTLSITNKVTFNSDFPPTLSGAFIENDFLYCFNYDSKQIVIFNWRDGRLIQSKFIPMANFYGFGPVGNNNVAIIWNDSGNVSYVYYSILNKITLAQEVEKGIIYVQKSGVNQVLKQEKLRNMIYCSDMFAEIYKSKKYGKYAVNVSGNADENIYEDMITFDNDNYAYSVGTSNREITIFQIVRE